MLAAFTVELPAALDLSPATFGICILAVTLAAIVRGFSGFALSALVMASLAIFIPPVTLIPVCILLEITASLMMFRGGMQEADGRVVTGLSIGSIIGVPIGLYATRSLPTDTSRIVALLLILILAALQLTQRSPAFLATRAGLYVSGLVAGLATGLASIGGMVVALYVLAQDAPPRRMRASLVMFLFVSMFSSSVWLAVSGMFDTLAFRRGAVFAPFVVLGVLIGTRLFIPSLQPFYRRFCLLLLMSLALTGLVRLALGA